LDGPEIVMHNAATATELVARDIAELGIEADNRALEGDCARRADAGIIGTTSER